MKFKNALRRFLRSNRGSAAVQFAFVGPVLLVISLAIIDMGRLMWMNATIGYAADQGGRYAAVHGINGNFPNPPADEDDVRDHILNQISGIKPSDLTVAVNWNPDKDQGAVVTVQLQYTFDFLGLRVIGLNDVRLDKVSRMTVL